MQPPNGITRVSLPRREFMERAIKIWEEEGLPKLNMAKPGMGTP